MSEIEIYTAGYRLEESGLNWKEALRNFIEFADRVTICINGIDNSIHLVGMWKLHYDPLNKLNIVNSSFSYDDPFFDGKIKNEALQATTKPVKVLLDLDERIPVTQRPLWDWSAGLLLANSYDAILIPSVNLCGSIFTYKDIGYKWYLHKQGLKRGVVNFAKLPNGKIDITKSDTCELLKQDGSLATAIAFDNNIDKLRTGTTPFVYHLWCIDPEQRLKQNEFWGPVWENRKGSAVTDIINDKATLESIPTFKHDLPLWV